LDALDALIARKEAALAEMDCARERAALELAALREAAELRPASDAADPAPVRGRSRGGANYRSWRTPERDAILRRDYPANVPMAVIRERLDAAGGPPLPTNHRIATTCGNTLHIGRTQRDMSGLKAGRHPASPTPHANGHAAAVSQIPASFDAAKRDSAPSVPMENDDPLDEHAFDAGIKRASGESDAELLHRINVRRAMKREPPIRLPLTAA